MARDSLELLKNSILEICKTALIIHFNATKIDGEFIFQKSIDYI